MVPPTRVAPSRAASTSSAHSSSSADGWNAPWIASSCAGWIADLPVKPSLASHVRPRRAAARPRSAPRGSPPRLEPHPPLPRRECGSSPRRSGGEGLREGRGPRSTGPCSPSRWSRPVGIPDARAYLARKRADGKTGPEARRCLKRHLAAAIYRAMIKDACTHEDPRPSRSLTRAAPRPRLPDPPRRGRPRRAAQRMGRRTPLPRPRRTRPRPDHRRPRHQPETRR